MGHRSESTGLIGRRCVDCGQWGPASWFGRKPSKRASVYRLCAVCRRCRSARDGADGAQAQRLCYGRILRATGIDARPKPPPAPPRFTCAGCGEAFGKPYQSGPARTHCYECVPYAVPCRVCCSDVRYYPSRAARGGMVTCSPGCASMAGKWRAERAAGFSGASKSCSMCRQIKTLESFARQKGGVAGRHSYCLSCKSATRSGIDRDYIYARDNGRCQLRCSPSCKPRLPKQGWHVDHIVPVYHGGTNDASNLQAACATCNTSKRERAVNEQLRLIG